MLIVCPSCATSYKIDPAAVGAAGRMVRCARCKATWFTGGPKPAPEVANFVDSVIAEAEAQSTGSTRAAPSAEAPPQPAQATADDFGTEDSESRAEVDTKAPRVEPPPPQPAPAPTDAHSPEPVTIADAPSLVPMEQALPP